MFVAQVKVEEMWEFDWREKEEPTELEGFLDDIKKVVGEGREVAKIVVVFAESHLR